MRSLVLGLGYRRGEYEATRNEWRKHGIEFDFADDFQQAVRKLGEREYVCVAVCSDYLPHDDIDALRRVRAIPIVVLPAEYNAAQRYECVQRGAAQYISAARHRLEADMSGKDNMRYCLDLSDQERQPLTIITVKDLTFCLEYRTVEVRGQRIDLTAKEFDILALFITNQRRVFTYEMMMDLIWQEDYSYYSRKAVNNHISNLRGKLKIAPDVPDYIKSVHSVGYKFEP